MTDEMYAEFLGNVASGRYDEHLDSMGETLRERRKYVARMNAKLIGVGDRVVTTKIKPRYLEGRAGQVIERTGDRAWVVLDVCPPQGLRYRRPADGAIGFPATCLAPE